MESFLEKFGEINQFWSLAVNWAKKYHAVPKHRAFICKSLIFIASFCKQMEIYILPHVSCNRRRNFSLTKKRATSYNIQKCCNKTLAIFKLDPTQSNMLQHVATGWPNASNTRHYFIVFILILFYRKLLQCLV